MPAVVFAVTFAVFFAEALIHYNVGARRAGRRWTLPTGTDLAVMVGTVAAFSALNAALIWLLHLR